MIASRKHSSLVAPFGALMLLLRVLSLLLVLQISGGITAFCEIAGSLSSDACAHDEPCSSEKPCQDCPPGCPSCRCASGLRSLVPELRVELTRPEVTAPVAVPRPGRDGPAGPEPSPPYRPPRA